MNEYNNYQVAGNDFDKKFPDNIKDFATIFTEIESLVELDERIIGPMYDIKNIEETKEAGSGINKIDKIKNTPLMIFKA